MDINVDYCRSPKNVLLYWHILPKLSSILVEFEISMLCIFHLFVAKQQSTVGILDFIKGGLTSTTFVLSTILVQCNAIM